MTTISIKRIILLLLEKVVNVFDLGYLGVETDFLEQLSSIPNRKKRKLELLAEEKEYNKNHSRERIVIEQPFVY